MCNRSTIFLYCRTCLHKYKHTYRETHVNSIWAIFCIRNVSCLYCIRMNMPLLPRTREKMAAEIRLNWNWENGNESLANDKRFYLLYQMTKHINWLQLVLYALHISNQTVCFFPFSLSNTRNVIKRPFLLPICASILLCTLSRHRQHCSLAKWHRNV